jgi:hypothetical protein
MTFMIIQLTYQQKRVSCIFVIVIGLLSCAAANVFCVIESIRKDPDKYAPLIYYNDDSNNDDSNTFSISPVTISPIAAYYNRSSYTFKEFL